MMLKTTRALLGMALLGAAMSAYDTLDRVCVGFGPLELDFDPDTNCGITNIQSWYVGYNCDNNLYCKDTSITYASAGTCSMVGRNCDLCYGCGQGRLFGGTPSCRTCPSGGGGCDQDCGEANLAGGCTACGVLPGSPAPTNTTAPGPCGDLNEFLQTPLATLLREVDEVFCEDANNESVGFLFLGALLDSSDMTGDGSLTCDEYKILKLVEPPRSLYGYYSKKHNSHRHHHRGTTKLPKPKCELNPRGKRAYEDYNNYLANTFRRR